MLGLRKSCFSKSNSVLTLFRSGFFGVVHGLRRGAKSPPPFLHKICLILK